MKRLYGVLVALALSTILGVALSFRFNYHEIHSQASWSTGLLISMLAGAAIGSTLGVFLFSGILPALLWAFSRFRREHTTWVTIIWCVLALLISGLNYKARAYEECRQHATIDNCI